MFKEEGFSETDFMSALHSWDCGHVTVRCINKGTLTEFSSNISWKSDFKVDGSMILNGTWFIKRDKER